MSDHVPIQPNDEDPHSHHHAVLHARVLAGKGLLIEGPGIKISTNEKGQYLIKATAQSVAVAAGIRYAVPIEIVSGRAYSKGERVHVQPDHLLVTTGIRDRAVPTGPLVQSRAGWYIAMQDVPAKSTVSGNDVWDLPQFPFPVPTNMDDKKNFWEWMPDNYC